MKSVRYIIYSLLLSVMTACVEEEPATIEFASAEYNLLVGEKMDFMKEVVISNVDRASFEAVSNPVVLVMDLDRFFDVVGEEGGADGVSVRYELKPKEKTGIDYAVVEVVRKDASIRRLSFVLEGNIPFDVDIKKYRHVPVRDAGDFTFPSSEFDSSWVVTDLFQ